MKTKHHLACRPLLVVGTRPEGIKMAPVIRHCLARPDVEPIVCFTGQHQQMLAQVADYFEIVPNIDLGLMKPNQSLSSMSKLACAQAISTHPGPRNSIAVRQASLPRSTALQLKLRRRIYAAKTLPSRRFA
jgi:hypothetical protein